MQDQHRYNTVRKATLISASTNFLLALFKIIVGYIGHSHALIADGLHSFSDLITDGLVLLASKAGGRSPDKEHPYGHQRIETLSVIVIALLLMGVAAVIVIEAVPDQAHFTRTLAKSEAVIGFI